MAVEDREHHFEKALARHLRANSPRPGGAEGSCPDPETLAAYHERLLAPAEMNFWKEHISGCMRCQQILTHVEETGAIALDAETKEATVTAGHAAAPVLQLKPRRARRWVWTAPVGALAAGLLIWVTLHETPPRLDMAKNQPMPASLPANSRTEAVPAVKQPAATDEFERLNPAVRTRSDDSSGKLYGQEGLKRSRGELAATKPREPERKDGMRAQTLADSGRTLALDADSGAPGKSAEKKIGEKRDAPAISALNETVEVASEPSPPPAPSAAPAPQSLSKAKVGLAGAAAKAQPKEELQQMQGMSRFKEEPSVRLANAKSHRAIVAPGERVSWRVGPAGTIERSEDRGATWTIQASGVVADLFTGSAVSEQVCWVVGRLGMILRTTDGGAHWVKIQPPLEDDITAVFAVNAQQATVSLAQGSYQTLDGGATWKKLAPE